MKKRLFKRYALWLTLIVIIAVSGACSEYKEQPLRLGTNVWLGYEPLYLARSLGYFQPKTVRLVEYVSATQVMRGLIDGAIDAGGLTLDEAILLQQQGVDISIVLVMDYSSGADALIARPDIKNLKGLRGKRVGVETTALGAYIMQRILEISGLMLNEVNLVSIELSQHEQAYKNATVDAVVTFDPVRSRLLSQGGVSLFDSTQIPGEVVDVLVIRNNVAQKNKNNLVNIMEGWFKVLEYINNNPQTAAEKMSARLKLNNEEVLGAMQGVRLPDYNENRNLLLGDPAVLSKQADRLVNVMVKNNLLAGSVQSESLFDNNLLDRLYP